MLIFFEMFSRGFIAPVRAYAKRAVLQAPTRVKLTNTNAHELIKKSLVPIGNQQNDEAAVILFLVDMENIEIMKCFCL